MSRARDTADGTRYVDSAGDVGLTGAILNNTTVNNIHTKPVFGGNWNGSGFWGIGSEGTTHRIRIGERDNAGNWATQSSDISLIVGGAMVNTQENTKTYLGFNAAQANGSYGSYQKVNSATSTGSNSYTGSWTLNSTGDVTVPEDGRYLITYYSGGDGHDNNWQRVIIGINQSRSGSNIEAYTSFRNQFGTFTNPNSVNSGVSDGVHSVLISQVYRALAGDLFEFYGSGALQSAWHVRVTFTKVGEL